MEKHTRIYPAQSPRGGWVGKLLLFLSAVVIISGLVSREDPNDLSIRAAATPTPIPLNESFDETMTETEFTTPSITWYALQLGTFETEKAAQEAANQYIMRGAGGFVWHDGRYRTLAAVYPTREDAQSVRTRLAQQHGVDTYLFEIHLPAIQLRLSGMKGQTDLLEAAFIHASDLAAQLYALSIALDRQEISVSECVSQLKLHAQTIQTVSLRLNQRFRKPEPDAVKGFCELFEAFSAFAFSCDTDTSNVTLGSQMKYQTLSALYMLSHVYDTISHT